jgi:hypothetical protein
MPTTVVAGKTHIYCRQEWLVGVLLFLVLGGVRLHLLFQNPSNNSNASEPNNHQQHLYEHVTTHAQVKEKTTLYCNLDLTFLCDLPPIEIRRYEDKKNYHCIDKYGSILVNIWAMHTDILHRNGDDDDCSLKTQMVAKTGSLQHVPNLDFTNSVGISDADLNVLQSEENQRLGRLLLYTYFCLYRKVVSNPFHVERKQKHPPHLRLKRHHIDDTAMEEGDKMIQVVLVALFDMFAESTPQVPAPVAPASPIRSKTNSTTTQTIEQRRPHRHRHLDSVGSTRRGTVTMPAKQTTSSLTTVSVSKPTSYAVREGILKKTWTEEQVLSMMEWAARHAMGSKHYDIGTYQSQFLPRVLEGIAALRSTMASSFSIASTSSSSSSLSTATTTSSSLSSSRTSSSLPANTTTTTTTITTATDHETKHSYHIFFHASQEQCLYPHFEAGTLITHHCQDAMTQAPLKYKELELEVGGDFTLLSSHFLAIAGNGILFMILMSLCTARGRLEQRIERGKRRLEQELQDPFLRKLDNNKYNSSHKNSSSSSSDSNGDGGGGGGGGGGVGDNQLLVLNTQVAALKLFRRQVRIFRCTLLFCLVALVVLFGFLWMFHVASLERFLENAMFNITAMTATYWLPMNNISSSKSNEGNGVDEEEETMALISTTRNSDKSSSWWPIRTDANRTDKDNKVDDDEEEDDDIDDDDEVLASSSSSSDDSN